MNHKYSQIKDLNQLEDEILKLKLRKTIIRNEFSSSLGAAKNAYLSGRYLLSLVLSTFGSAEQSKEEIEADTFDRITSYSSVISNMLNLINSFRK